VVLPFATAVILLAVGPEPGSGVGIRKAVGRTARRLPALVVVGIAQTIGVFVGLLLLILPGLALAARWLLAIPAIVFEQRSGNDALRRSNSLVRGQTWAIIACVALLTAFSVVVWGASFVVVLLWGHDPVSFTGLAAVFDALTLGVWAAMSLAAYRRLVSRPDSG
jgi:hypothetical protein